MVSHEQNRGYGSAIRTIFLKAKELDADMLVTFDADGQHRIEDIEKVVLPIKNNQADIVIGSRFLENSSKIPKYRKLGINIITKVTNTTINEKITDSQSGFRAYNRKTLEKERVKIARNPRKVLSGLVRRRSDRELFRYDISKNEM